MRTLTPVPPTFPNETPTPTPTATPVTTVTPVTTPPAPTPAPALPLALHDVLGAVAVAAVVVGVAALIAVRILAKRRARGVVYELGGYYNLSTALQGNPDAVAMVVDRGSRSIYWVPLYYQGGYYTFRMRGRVGVFVPSSSSVYRCGAKPCFVVLRSRDLALEFDPELSAKLWAGAAADKEVAKAVESPFMVGFSELYRRALEAITPELARRSGTVPTAAEVVFDATPPKIYEDMVDFLSEMTYSVVASLKGLGEIAMITGGAIERRAGGTFEFMRYLPYLAVALAIVMLVMMVMGMVGGPPR